MKSHTHPIEGPPAFTVAGMKLDAKGNLSCFSCHDPHSSDEKRLFTVKGGCDGCHDLSKQTPATTEEQ
jgi:predicted CXXCH cytochrome family protein